MRVGLALAGLLGAVGQVVLLRELAAALYGNEFVYGLALTAWMLWVATGALLSGRILRHAGREAYAAMLILAAPLLATELAAVRGLRPRLGVTTGSTPDLWFTMAACVLCPAPLCLVEGALFPLGARLLAQGRRAPARAYSLESAGSVLGGAAFTLVVAGRLAPFQLALCLVGVSGLVAAGIVLRHRPAAVGAAIVGVAALGAAVPVGGALDWTTLRWSWPATVATADSPYGRLLVESPGAQRAFYQDGRLLFETQSTQPQEVAHLPLAAHQDPGRVLLVGGGLDGTLREVLKEPVTRVDYVETDPYLVALARRLLSADATEALDDPRVVLRLADGRQAVRDLEGPFDVVIVHVPEPSTAEANRFYTTEFFRDLSARLAPDGVLSLGLPSAESYWSRPMRQRNLSIVATLAGVFPHVAVTSGDTSYLLASRAPLALDASLLAERLKQRGIDAPWLNEARLRDLLQLDRSRSLAQGPPDEPEVRQNRDAAPIAYLYELRLWLARVSGPGSFVLSGTAARAVVPLLLLLLAAAMLWRRRPAERLTSAAAVGGFAVMALEVTLLLGYQSARGSLYREVGLLVAAFMLGLTLGARTTVRHTWPGVQTALLALGAVSVAFVPLLAAGSKAPASLYVLGGLAAGAAGGAVFGGCSGLATGSVAGTSGQLYAADLVGASAGALCASLLLVPVLGMTATCVAVALVSGAAAPLVGAQGLRLKM
jgi:spermidine synthase